MLALLWLANHYSGCTTLHFANIGPRLDFYSRCQRAIIGDLGETFSGIFFDLPKSDIASTGQKTVGPMVAAIVRPTDVPNVGPMSACYLRGSSICIQLWVRVELLVMSYHDDKLHVLDI